MRGGMILLNILTRLAIHFSPNRVTYTKLASFHYDLMNVLPLWCLTQSFHTCRNRTTT
ncbi:hypothetical protein D1872_298550 [compost metagenome]